MRFGLSLPHYGFSLAGGAPITFDEVAAWAQRAETLGFDSLWISDHFFYSFERYGADATPIAAIEPLTAIAGLAAVTDRIRLGTLVLGAPFRHPSIVAKMATTIDGISGGRLELGVGAGWLEEEFTAFGYRYGSVGERFDSLEETLRVLQALFSGEPVTLDGPTVSLRGVRLLPEPVAAAHPGVGGRQGRASAAAARGSTRRWLERRVAVVARGLWRASRCRARGMRT